MKGRLEPGTVVDRYRVESVIGSGGMATVYRVRHLQLGSEHALKVIAAPTRDIRDRLMQEGQLQALLRHPNIVCVTDAIDVDGSPGLIMEIVQGPSLQGLLERRTFTLEQADILAQGVLAGVAEAHRHDMVHRDLKPANVLLVVARGTLTPKVADFGLAKVLAGAGPAGSGRTRSGAALGTPSYMAPEQIRDAKNVDRRADVFSLGCVLYEMVCGRRAFDGPDTITVFQAIGTGRYVAPRVIVPALPERMGRAIRAALEVDLDRRTPDVDALLDLWMGGKRRRGAGPWSDAELSRASELGARPAPLGALAAVVQQTMGHTWSGEEVPRPQPWGAATVELEKEPAVGIEPPSLFLDGPLPLADETGETTIVHRIHRQYGIAAAVAAVLISGLAVVALGLLGLGLLYALVATPVAPEGPSLEIVLPEG